jgi:hypothetical protein
MGNALEKIELHKKKLNENKNFMTYNKITP